MKSKNFSRFLWVLIVATQLFFFISALKSNHTRSADSAEYLYMAYNLQHHGLIYSGDAEAAERDLSLYSRRTPGYPLFLLVGMIGIGSGILPLAIQCLLSLLSIYLGSRILRSIHPAETAQSLYLALLLFFPSQFIYPAFYMTETLFQSALLLSIFFLFRFEERGTYSLYYLHHFFLAAMYLVKPAAMFLWLGVTLYSIFSHHFVGVNRRQVFISLLHILLLGSIFIKNHQRTGIAEYSSIGRKLIINYNLPDLLTYTKGADYSARVIDSLQQQLK
ncbi:MAG: glycosyltransferase family 39 protein, partial [Bacteroidia bacterium]|nr:glycosyltransferase family 39 protein [Bacteroidia bacterium]